MASVLVDSNVWLDLVTQDPVWAGWSRSMVEQLAGTSVLVTNPIVYAEVSVAFDSIEELDDALSVTLVEREPLPYAAGFLAGKAHERYRRRGGVRNTPLPDFYIGAHAAVAGYQVLTRDAARYRTYFPTLDIIAPP